MSVSLIVVVCFAVSFGFALLSAAIARLVLTLLSCIARGRLHASNSAVFRLLSGAASLFFVDFDLASCLVVSGGVLLATIHRESSLCLHSLLSKCFALHWDSLVDWVC